MSGIGKIILVALMLAGTGFAQFGWRVENLTQLKPSAAGCATADTSLAHDVVLEGFQTATTGYENSGWGTNGTGTITFNPADDTSALTTSKPAGACNQALLVTVAADSAAAKYVTYTNGSVIDLDTQTLDVVLSFYVRTKCADNKQVAAVLIGSAPATRCCNLWFGSTSGNPRVFVENSATVNLTENAWNTIAIHLDTATTGNTSTMTVNGGSPQGFNRVSNSDFQFISVGGLASVDAGDTCAFNVDVIAANTP